MSAWWLVLIIPLCMAAGAAIAQTAWKRAAARIAADERPKTAAPVLVKVTRYIPGDLWMEKLLEKGGKGASAWLAISMGQMLGPELAPYTTVKTLYRPENRDYQVTAWVWVVPKNERRSNYENHD